MKFSKLRVFWETSMSIKLDLKHQIHSSSTVNLGSHQTV